MALEHLTREPRSRRAPLQAFEYAGAPSSGTTGTLAGIIDAGALLFDKTNKVLFVNEGTKASPYYSPASPDQRPLWGVWDDFRNTAGKALADTAAAAFLVRSGLRIFGQGIDETDSGMVVQAVSEGGYAGRLTTTDEASHTAAMGTAAGNMQPDQHQLLVVEANLTHVSAITLRSMFIGFVGLAADALDPVVTGATTTLTLVLDDLAGLFFDVGLTAATRLYAPHNKSDEAATIATTATGVDTGVAIPAAATYCRLRVEIDAAGVMRCFKDKAEITKISAALDVDEEVSPVLYVGSTSAAVKSMDVKEFRTYAYR